MTKPKDEAPFQIAVVYRGDPDNPDEPPRHQERLRAVLEALKRQGLLAQPVVYLEETSTETLHRLLSVDAALVWVNPLEKGRTRSSLDPLLRSAAAAGVLVSADPDVVDRMATKEVLFTTRTLGWGGDVRRYETMTALQDGLFASLSTGDVRVLKPVRGNDGQGVVKVSLSWNKDVTVQWASDDRVVMMTLPELLTLFEPHMAQHGAIIDQPFNDNLGAGMVRCYMVEDRVIGFARQQPRAHGANAFGMNSAKAMYPADCETFADLRSQMETDWVPGMQALLGLQKNDLPLLWDADFLTRSHDKSHHHARYMLCEINASCVSPFPETAPNQIAAALVQRLRDNSTPRSSA